MKINELTTKDTKNKAYPKYKPSGVEWLEDVPAHWVVKRAGLAFSIQLGKMLQPDTSASEDEQFEYLKALHVQWETIQTNELPVMWASNLSFACLNFGFISFGCNYPIFHSSQFLPVYEVLNKYW